jgi:hypothetical protein
VASIASSPLRMPVYDPLADPSAYSAVAAFCYVNVVCTSLLPLPAGWLMMIAAGVLFGEALGLVLYLLTSCLGAMITLAVVRSMPLVFESGFRSCLGKHTAAIWRRFDEALFGALRRSRHGGWTKPFIVRDFGSPSCGALRHFRPLSSAALSSRSLRSR